MRLSNEYDVLIIGGGPAGLAAGLYAGRSMLKTRLFEKELIGGQASITDIIENYPGFPEGITGFELAEKMREQAQKFDVELDMNEVTSVDLIGALKKVTTPDGEYTAKAIIIASGVRPTKLDVPGAAALTGRGISYCATCDGPFFRDKRVMVIGGGNSAVEEAIYLTKFASKVTIVHRRDQLRAEKIVQDRAFKNEKVDFLLDSVLSGVSGENSVSAVTVKNVKTGEEKEVGVEGIFVFVGNIPNTELFTGALDMDEVGYVITDDALMASIPGIFAAGDVRKNNLKQVVWAAAEGALAARDDGAHSGNDPVVPQQRRKSEPALGADILDHDGVVPEQGVAGLRRRLGRHGGATHQPRTPSHAGLKQQVPSLGEQLQDLRELDVKCPGHEGDCFIHQHGAATGRHGVPGELGLRRAQTLPVTEIVSVHSRVASREGPGSVTSDHLMAPVHARKPKILDGRRSAAMTQIIWAKAARGTPVCSVTTTPRGRRMTRRLGAITPLRLTGTRSNARSLRAGWRWRAAYQASVRGGGD